MVTPIPRPAPAPPPRLIVDRGGSRLFEDLTDRNRFFVKEQYQALLRAHERKDFAEMSDHCRNILSLVDEYNDTKSYEAIARRGLERVEQDRIRRDVSALEMAGRIQFGSAMLNPNERTPFLALVAQILEKEPNNYTALGWRRSITELMMGEQRRATTREIASLEIKGEGLVHAAAKSPDQRAELYQIMDRLRVMDPENTYPQEWRQRLHQGAR